MGVTAPGSQPRGSAAEGRSARENTGRIGVGCRPTPQSAGRALPAPPPPRPGVLQPRRQPQPLLTACPPPQPGPGAPLLPPVPVREGGGDRRAVSPGRRLLRSLPEPSGAAVLGRAPLPPPGPTALAALASRLTFPCLSRPSPAPSDVTTMATNPRPARPRPAGPAGARAHALPPEGGGASRPSRPISARRGAAWLRPLQCHPQGTEPIINI